MPRYEMSCPDCGVSPIISDCTRKFSSPRTKLFLLEHADRACGLPPCNNTLPDKTTFMTMGEAVTNALKAESTYREFKPVRKLVDFIVGALIVGVHAGVC